MPDNLTPDEFNVVHFKGHQYRRVDQPNGDTHFFPICGDTAIVLVTSPGGSYWTANAAYYADDFEHTEQSPHVHLDTDERHPDVEHYERQPFVTTDDVYGRVIDTNDDTDDGDALDRLAQQYTKPDPVIPFDAINVLKSTVLLPNIGIVLGQRVYDRLKYGDDYVPDFDLGDDGDHEDDDLDRDGDEPIRVAKYGAAFPFSDEQLGDVDLSVYLIAKHEREIVRARRRWLVIGAIVGAVAGALVGVHGRR